ncbi:MAG: restriction endonuclease subunit S [Methylomarinum sp.]|nr:restriction endonuclease subunit S [Methylomarinum sp.]
MSEVEEKELSEKWEWSTLGEVCEKPQYGWTTKASKEGNLHLLRTTDITAGQINWATVPYCVAEPEDTEKYRIKDGDIVVSRAGSVGVSYLISNPKPSVFASYLIRFKPLINRKYVYYFLKSPAYWNAISEKSSGIALQNVNATKLKEINIPIAPPAQQKQIVAKIEQLFSHIDAGIEALNTAKQRLKQYRQSVLKAAVTGELTKEWREVNKEKLEPASQLLERILQTRCQKWEEQQLEQFKAKGKIPKNDKWMEKYKAPKASVLHMDLEVPEEWEVASVDQVAEVFLGKMLDRSKHTTGERLPYLRNINVRWGHIDTNDLFEMFFKESELKRFEVIAGDVLICEGGEPGRAAVWKETNTTIKYQKALHRVRFYLPILPQYLVYLLEYFASTGLLARYFTGSTIKHFTKESFLTLPFPLPSLIEMQQIISVVDEKMNLSMRLEKEINRQLLKAEKNKQSILSSAFSGNL